jgi:Ca2+-transporting ATPase
MTIAADLSGLSAAQVSERRVRFGANVLQDPERHGFVQTLKSVFAEPMFLLLVGAAAIYLVIGDLGEGLLLLVFALMTVGLVVLQERRSERALDALRALAAPQVRVIRDGEVQRIPASDLVPGDLFLLGEGERVAADALLRDGQGVSIDESLLTGESVPVRKRVQPGPDMPEAATPGGDDLPWAYAGTLVVAGHGVAEVTTIGAHTQVGRIGATLAAIDTTGTPLEQQLRRLVHVAALGALLLSLTLVAWYGLQRGNWLQGVLSGIALGMGMLPEEFPMALSVLLALGAWRLAKLKVLARRPAVIEALGAVTVLCVDKTGTLTENRMQLRRLVTEDADITLDAASEPTESVHVLLEYAMLASRRRGIDPMDRAILAHGDLSLADTEHLHPEWLLQQEYPLTPELLAMSQAWQTELGEREVAAKGAPEAVAALCRFDEAATRALLARVQALADEGLRVIAVARGVDVGPEIRARQHDHEFRFLGLLGFHDPLRASVAPAVAEARQAGIAVAMITGDHALTALAIARQAGIATAAGALTGEALAAMDDAALAEAVREVRVFARIMPEQKLRLVRAFQSDGEVVAMTGDGVNDAPALKAAHVGIAMGQRGTDVAREAAGLVLLDDDFSRIVGGVRMGRRIGDNLRKVMTYITAIHVPIAGLAMLPVLMGLPPLMLPVHVVITEMVIDPVCSIAFEGTPEDPRIMQRPPRPVDEGLVGWAMLWRGLVQGGGLLAATLACYVLSLREGMPEETARALAFTALTFGNLLLVWVNASPGVGWRALVSRSFGAFWAVAAAATLAMVAAIAVPALRGLLHFAVPPPGALALSFALVVAALLAAARASRPASAAARRLAAAT